MKKWKNILAIIYCIIAFIVFLSVYIYMYFDIDDGEFKDIDDYIVWNKEINVIDKEQYEKDIFKTKMVNKNISIFPDKIIKDSEYYNYYLEVIGYKKIFIEETYLKYDFDTSTDFYNEINRLKNICVNKKILYLENLFSNPTYISVYSYNDWYEYAIIDYDNLIIFYIYLENNRGFYIFDEDLRPKKKLKDYSNYRSYNIYN